MKKFIIAAALLVAMTASAGIEHINGVWKSGNVEMTFTGDTLLIDEIDNEGNDYLYAIDSANNVIRVTDVCCQDTFSIKIVEVTPKRLKIYYMCDEKKEVMTFKRKRVQVPSMGW